MQTATKQGISLFSACQISYVQSFSILQAQSNVISVSMALAVLGTLAQSGNRYKG